MAPASIFAISPDGSRIAYIAQGHLFVHALATGVTADLGIVPVPTEGLLWSPDGRRLAFSAESDLRVIPAEGGPPFTVCRIPGSGRLTKGWWHDDGTIYFAVWRESLYRVPASGGTPARVTAIAPETEIDFHSVAVLPDGRLIVTTHLRGQDAVRLDLVDGGVRTPLRQGFGGQPPLADDLDIDIVRFRAPDELLFVRVRRNPGVWVVPFDGGRIDLTRATLLDAGARDFSVSSEGTLVSSVPARERRELVWVAHGSAPSGPGKTASTRSIATMPGAPFEVGAAVARALARRPARGVCHSRRRRRRGVPRARSGDRPRHARARAEGLDGRVDRRTDRVDAGGPVAVPGRRCRGAADLRLARGWIGERPAARGRGCRADEARRQ